jgi:hypothetical protein
MSFRFFVVGCWSSFSWLVELWLSVISWPCFNGFDTFFSLINWELSYS